MSNPHFILTNQILKVFNFGTPIALTAYYIVAASFAACTLYGTKTRPPSRRKRRVLITLTSIIPLCYLAQLISHLSHFSTATDNGLVHSISQILFWISLLLITVHSAIPVPLVYIGISVLNLILEIAIFVVTCMEAKQISFHDVTSLLGLQVLTNGVLVLQTIISVSLLSDRKFDEGDDERQSLLARRPSIVADQRSSETSYTTLDHQHKDEDSNTDESDLDTASVDEDDDKDIQATQQRRLEQDGGWIRYLARFKIFLPYIIPRNNPRLQFYVAVLLVNTVLQRFLNVLYPRQLGIIIDKLTTGQGLPLKEIFIWIILGIAESASSGLECIDDLLQHRLATWSRQQLTVASFDQVMSLSMNFHDQKDSGEIIKAVEQAESLNDLLKLITLDLAPAVMDVFIALWYVTYLFDVYALLILVAVGIAFVFVTFHISQLAIIARRLSAGKERVESKLVYEAVSNWYTILCFNRKSYAMNRLSNAVSNAATAVQWNEDLYSYMFAAQEWCEFGGKLPLSILAAVRIVNGTSSVGSFVTLESYWNTITFPLYVFGRSYRRLNSNLIDAERLLQIFEERPNITDNPGAEVVTSVKGDVAFQDVQFAYEGRENTLRNINLRVEPGQTIALVGETGGGKSTTLKLLMRFYDVTSGKITIDGIDIRDIKLNSLRELFGLVPQEAVLFNVSILENVRYGRLDASDKEVFEACKAASIHDKIHTFPNGYTSKVGERGVKLSGGERQRIAIARVFLKDPRIILLDEATSAMDSQTEAKIQDALKRLLTGRTAFVIAHRLSTIVEADRILVIDEGQVVESGTHHELLSRHGKYHQLWSRQAALAPT